MWHKKEAFVQDFSSPGTKWMLDLCSNGNSYYPHQFRYRGEVKPLLQMRSHDNICSVLPLQAAVPIWPRAPFHPSCLIPACSSLQPQLEPAFHPAWECSQTWCLQGAQTHLAQAMHLQKLPTPVSCRCSWQIPAGSRFSLLTEVFKYVLEYQRCLGKLSTWMYSLPATGTVLAASPSGRAALGVLLGSQNPSWAGLEGTWRWSPATLIPHLDTAQQELHFKGPPGSLPTQEILGFHEIH